MAETSMLRTALSFMHKLGVYDVVLPFLLVFTIVFAILEKTFVLGVDKIKDVEYSKKHLNSIVAFVVAFIVVASTKLIGIINEIVSNVVLLLIVLICFFMLIGVLRGTREVSLKDMPKWESALMILLFIGIVVIFLNSLGWLQFMFDIFKNSWNAEWAAAVVLIIVTVAFMLYITWDKPSGSSGGESK